MSLTKQHFIAIAKILKENQTKEDLTEAFIEYCKTQNKNFNAEMFREAVK